MQSRLISRPNRFAHRAIAAAVLATTLMLGACSSTGGSGDTAVTGEYADLNGTTTSSGQQYLDVNLEDDHVFTALNEDEAVDFLRTGTGVIYFGFPECPWCRAAMPVMDEAARNVELEQIQYLNVLDIRDTRSLSADGTVIIEEPGTDAHADILAELGDLAPEYEGLDDPTQRRIYVPLVVAVKDGEAIDSHVSTVASHADPFEPMTDEQHAELVGIYEDLFTQAQ